MYRSAQEKDQLDHHRWKGEPTLHPDLVEIVSEVRSLRNKYLPYAKLVILSNSSTLGREEVHEALKMIDMKVMKFDAGSEELVRQLNGPARPFYLGEIVEGLKRLRDVTLQSLFVQGRVTNADPDSVELWIQKVEEIQPMLVQIYSLDRVPAERRLWKVNLATLQWIANQVRWRVGVPVKVY